MNNPEPIVIPTDSGPLAGLLHLPENIPASLVICCHGMLSSKDSQKFAFIAEEMAKEGIVALRFDFSGCGESNAALLNDLLSSRLRDLRAVLDYVRVQDWHGGTIGLLGSSLGGYLSLLALAFAGDLIKAVVCWATPFDLTRIQTAMQDSQAFKGFFPAGFGLGSPVNLEDFQAGNGVLVIHGQMDELVPWSHALSIYRKAAEPKRLLLVREAEHRFVEASHRRLALKASLTWFRERGFMDGISPVP